MLLLFFQQNFRSPRQVFFTACLALTALLSPSLSLASPPPPPPQPTTFRFEERAEMHNAVHFVFSLSANGQVVYNKVRVNMNGAPPAVVINLPQNFTVTATLEIIETSTGKLLGSGTKTQELLRDAGASLDLRARYTSPPDRPPHQAVVFAKNTEFRREGVCELKFGHSWPVN